MALCRDLKLFSQGTVPIDSSKFNAVNSRDRNFTPSKIDKQSRLRESEHGLKWNGCSDGRG